MSEWRDIVFARRNTPYELRMKMPGSKPHVYDGYGCQFYMDDEGDWRSVRYHVRLTPTPVEFRIPEQPEHIRPRQASRPRSVGSVDWAVR